MNPGSMAASLRIRAAASRCCIPQPTELLVCAKNLGCKIGLITNG
jgi:hypothetical protein